MISAHNQSRYMATNSFVDKIPAPKICSKFFSLCPFPAAQHTKNSWLLLSISRPFIPSSPQIPLSWPDKFQYFHSKINSNTPQTQKHTPTAKFNLYEVLGGRGLCNCEERLQEELQKNVTKETEKTPPLSSSSSEVEKKIDILEISENGFEKELLGLTGGFPGGEKGLIKFIEKNPPPKKEKALGSFEFDVKMAKAKAPELPMLLPGMIAIVKNPNNPFYMYCGIVQRTTDGKAGVRFEGGNWDKLITFRLEELERREKGPPMVNPRSPILEEMVENSS